MDVLVDIRAGTTIDVGVSIGTRVDFMVDLMIAASVRVLADAITIFLPGVSVDILKGMNVNMVAAAMTALEFMASASL